jgi:hypothetical protein
MIRRRTAIALWLLFAAVTWNVIFDRLVWTAATDITRDQILSYQAGGSLTSIHDGFSPDVRRAAVQASFWTLPILAGGACALVLSFRRMR